MSHIETIRIGCSDSEDESYTSSSANDSSNLSNSPLPAENRRVTRSMRKSSQQRQTERYLTPRRRNGRSKKKNNIGNATQAKKTSIIDASKASMDDVVLVEDTSDHIKKKKTVILEGDLELTIDDISDEEIEETIRVTWARTAELHRFELKPSDKMQAVFESLSKKYDWPINRIVIRNGERSISMYDTLKSLNLKVTSSLEAFAISEESISCKEKALDKLEIKVQHKSWKKPVSFYVHPNQDFTCVLKECACDLGCAPEVLFLKFDGEKVSPCETPASLDLEGGECFEVYHKT